MNKLLAAVALCVCTASANAADLPARTSAPAPSPIAPVSVFSWTGAYVGAAVGIDYFVEKGPQTSTTRDEGFVGGAFAGYNAQFGSLVVGLEADIEGTGGVSNGYTYSLPVVGGYSSKIGLQGSARARLGYAYQNVLYYVTGGVAMADVDINYFHNNVRQGFGETATGWTLGMGVDWAFYPNWVARFEYRYTDFGTVSNGLDMTWGFNIVNPTLRHEITSQAFRFGIAYRFGGRI
jgi:outer membrane immunogenic protein